jgi:signal peptidase I
VTVNGQPLDEPYVMDNSPLDVDPTPGRCGPRKFKPVVIGPGNMWVMGDHRMISQDSRCQGPVPIANVIGKAFIVVWPKDDWATLGTPPTFGNIPKPSSAGPYRQVTPDLRPVGPAQGSPEAPDAALVTPLVASLLLPARSGLVRRSRRRRLRP